MVSPAVRIDDDGEAGVLHLHGALDLSTVEDVRSAATAQLAREGCNEVLIDAADLTFIDSTGIGCLVDISNHAREAQKHFHIINTTPAVARILDLVALDHLYS